MKKIILTTISSFIGLYALSAVAGHGNVPNQGDNAPCVVLEGITHDGKNIENCIRNEEFSEKRYTVLKFFSVLCGDCTKLHNKFVEIFGNDPSLLSNTSVNYIGIDRSVDALMNYAIEKRDGLSVMQATVYFDNERGARHAYGASLTPTLYVLDTHDDFKVVYKHVGVLSDANFERFLESFSASEEECSACS